jgi:DNA-binding CsgD family transcriptional regulator
VQRRIRCGERPGGARGADRAGAGSGAPLDEGVRELEQQLAAKKGELVQMVLQLKNEREKRRSLEENLHAKEMELERTVTELSEVQTALKVLLERARHENDEHAGLIRAQVRSGVFPYLFKLKEKTGDGKSRQYLEAIETRLKALAPSLPESITKVARQLTPMEIRITDMIRDGMSSKEIGSLLNLSTKAVDFHRNNIRGKLGLKSSKVTLKSYLASL